MKTTAKTILGVAVIAAALFGTMRIQKELTEKDAGRPHPDNMTYLPTTDAIKPWLLGFHATYAEFLWIKTVLYFGSHSTGDHDFRYLVAMLDIVTKLNPGFFPAYEFAGLILPEVCHNYTESRIILERGLRESENVRYKIPFYLSMIYYSHYQDKNCLLYTSPSPRDRQKSRMPSSA